MKKYFFLFFFLTVILMPEISGAAAAPTASEIAYEEIVKIQKANPALKELMKLQKDISLIINAFKKMESEYLEDVRASQWINNLKSLRDLLIRLKLDEFRLPEPK